MSFKMSLFVLL